MSSSLYSYDRLADRIKLSRQVTDRPAVVVEGRNDERFIGKVSPLGDIEVFIANTRDRVLDAAVGLHALEVDRVACVLDRDFDDRLATAEAVDLPVAGYDNADLEAMLWNSVALDDMLGELGSDAKIASFGGVAALRAVTREALLPLTRLRRANAIHGWGLNFDDLDLASKVDLRTLSIGIPSLCDALWHPGLNLPPATLYAAASNTEIPACPHTATELIRGKDALVVTGVALRRLVGSLSHQQASSERLEGVLRLSVSDGVASSSTWLARVLALIA